MSFVPVASASGSVPPAVSLTGSPSSYPSLARFTGHVQLKGLAPRSVEAYLCMARQLAKWAGCDPASLGEERVRDYFLHLKNARAYAPATMRQARAALSCFFIDMLGVQGWRVFELVKTKHSQQLPAVLSREEVARILSEVRELRFRAPLTLIYLCGLRLSEALHVEARDIDRAAMRLHVRLGKGGKDRFVPLPQAALDILSLWWRDHRHKFLLFPAMGLDWKTTYRDDPDEQRAVQRAHLQGAEHPMSTGALQSVWRLALATSGVTKPATIHTLRHSYATHLLEEGVSLRYVSQYLGHASLEQTLVYTHLTAVSEEQTQQALARLAASLNGTNGANGTDKPGAKPAPAPPPQRSAQAQ